MDDDRIVSGHIVDVLNREIYDGSVVVRNGRIESIVRSEVSSDAPYILPGMVDSHVHIESTLLIPEKYAALAVEKGVVAVVSDPHEIANVLGVPGELLEGYIDSLVRRSLAKGMPLWNVLNAACVTPVRHYGLRNGLLQQGDSADFIVVDNLQDFNVLSTFIDGRAVYENGMLRSDELLTDPSPLDVMPNRFAAGSITADDIRVTPAGELMKVIVAENLSIRTGMKYVRPLVKDGNVISDTGHDVLKMVVCNRYESAVPQMAFISGFRLKRGAMASTIAHDSHNIVAVGASDAELVRVINRLTELRGGIVISDGNGGISELPLPVAGLMSPLDGREVARRFSHLLSQAASQGCPFSAAFMTLSFMCLPVIPDLKLTDKGLFDVRKFGFTNLFV